MDVLARIIATKREELAERRLRLPLAELRARVRDLPPPRPFAAALAARIAEAELAVIAEIKRASPSQGRIREDFDPVLHARQYQAGGAAALSVLTDERFFEGRAEFLMAARTASGLPALRKDFLIDPWQIYEARLLGADAVLLIAACLGAGELTELAALARELALEVLIEVHGEEELAAALAAGEAMIGINHRDLRSFRVDLAVSERLVRQIPPQRMVVAESGIASGTDLRRLAEHGIRAFLIGERLMRAPDPGLALKSLLSDARASAARVPSPP
ncbi:MAG: indole-3-glycerol phosphate synthase [Lysobacterales bacterium]|jgi:indole-3-glycerol phosphate synthase|nr:MAG: indole-3-glycerol phosphate synthase [Xanthomonadales bacterium]